ncbi:hypothetical protein QEN19_000473 [Hanseniaspora menglaensis]
MHIFKTFIVYLLASIAAAHGSSQSNGQAGEDDDFKYLNNIFSLPDFLANEKLVNNKDKGLPNYNFFNTELNNGRIIIKYGDEKGGIISKTGKKFATDDSFSLEYTVRNLAKIGEEPDNDDKLFKSDDNLALFLTSDVEKLESLTINSKDITNLQFNGLMLYLDSKGKYGGELRFLMNDGSTKYKDIQEFYDSSIGSCLVNYYEDSSIPITIRLNYDASAHLLSVQVDNKICLQTKAVSLAQMADGKNYKIAVTSSGLDNSNSNFELLKLNFFDKLTKSAYLPNVKAMPQPKLLTKIINKDTGDVSYEEIDKLSESDINLLKLYKKLNTIEGKVIANDNVDLYAKVDRLEEINIQQIKKFERLYSLLETILSNGEGINKNGASALDKTEFKDFIAVNDKLEKLLEEQEQWKATHQYNAKSNKDDSKVHVDEIIFRLLLWLSPLGIIMLVMVYFTFTIKREIGKQKLL